MYISRNNRRIFRNRIIVCSFCLTMGMAIYGCGSDDRRDGVGNVFQNVKDEKEPASPNDGFIEMGQEDVNYAEQTSNGLTLDDTQIAGTIEIAENENLQPMQSREEEDRTEFRIPLKNDANHAVSIDIDGDDVEESVYYKWDDSINDLYIYVDGEEMFDLNFADIGPSVDSQVYLTDLDTSDSYLDFIFYITEENDYVGGIYDVQYVNKESDWLWGVGPYTLGYDYYSLSKYQEGDGTLRLDVMYQYEYFGTGFMECTYELSGNLYDGCYTHQVDDNHYKISPFCKEREYIATIDLNVYDTPGSSNSLFSIAKDDVFYVYEIKVDGDNLYLKVMMDTTKETGWILCPSEKFYQNKKGEIY